MNPRQAMGVAGWMILLLGGWIPGEGRLGAAEVKQTGTLRAPEATQAATADERFIYAISSTGIAKYDRATGARVAISTGPAHHLNSGFLSEGKIYCAHSNYPQRPEKS